MHTTIIGGGAAGFFAAVNLKEMKPEMGVTILERGQRVLRKVEVSGGGRCNCTNTFEAIGTFPSHGGNIPDLSAAYPRGHRLLRRLFNHFDHRDAFAWWERHGVPLMVQPDHCVFPASQDSHTIIDCLLGEARRLGVVVRTGQTVASLDALPATDFILVATGGAPKAASFDWLHALGHEIEPPVPSLFSLSTDDTELKQLMGTVAENAIVQIPGTHLRAQGALLLTHWGMSGPAILRLSSYGARVLHENNYKGSIVVNWPGVEEGAVRETVVQLAQGHRMRQLAHTAPFGLTQRLWNYLLTKAIGSKSNSRWCDLGKKDLNRIVNVLTSDVIPVTGRAPFHDEFVTCGGVSLKSIHANTLESRTRPNLFFAGEVLDIDGITGGFNFQAAWTTAYVAAKAIAEKDAKL